MPDQKDNMDECIIPNFCDARSVLLLIVLCELLAFILSLASGPLNASLWERLASYSFFIQWNAIVDASVLCMSRPYLRKLPNIPALILLYSVLVLNTYLISIAIQALYAYQGITEFIVDPEQVILQNILISSIVCAVLLRYFYLQHDRNLRVKAQAKSQFLALQARIRPHFLFNSMNTISSLIAIDPEKAEDTIADLSDLFRASLSDHPMNTWESEIALVHNYLDIEKLRLGKRLRIDWDFPEEANGWVIPALSLQPLVENAVYHGIEPMKNGGEITIHSEIKKDKLYIKVGNPIAAISESRRQQKGNQIALDNTRERLQLAFGQDAKMDIQHDPEYYLVTLVIPKQRQGI